MDGIKVVNIGHCVIKNCSTGEVLWEGEMPAELPELAPTSCAVDEYDALMRRLYLRLHRKLWNWIADETERTHKCVDKWDAFEHFGWNCINGTCWCCKYARWKRKYQTSETGCENLCLVDWGTIESTGERMCCVFNDRFGEESAFEYWEARRCDGDWKKAAKVVRIVANMPERK